MTSHNDKPSSEPRFDRREALFSSTLLALGGTLGALAAATGCRAPQIHFDYPEGSPTGYLIDVSLCTRCGDCERVCKCDAVGGLTGKDVEKHTTDKKEDPDQCWIFLDKCCACGRCYRVCEPLAIVPCYGPAKKPLYQIPKHTKRDYGPTHQLVFGKNGKPEKNSDGSHKKVSVAPGAGHSHG